MYRKYIDIENIAEYILLWFNDSCFFAFIQHALKFLMTSRKSCCYITMSVWLKPNAELVM